MLRIDHRTREAIIRDISSLSYSTYLTTLLLSKCAEHRVPVNAEEIERELEDDAVVKMHKGWVYGSGRDFLARQTERDVEDIGKAEVLNITFSVNPEAQRHIGEKAVKCLELDLERFLALFGVPDDRPRSGSNPLFENWLFFVTGFILVTVLAKILM